MEVKILGGILKKIALDSFRYNGKQPDGSARADLPGFCASFFRRMMI